MITITPRCVAYLSNNGRKYLSDMSKNDCALNLLRGRSCQIVNLESNERHEYIITLLYNDIELKIPYDYVSAIFLP